MQAKQLESQRLKLVPLSSIHLSQDYVNWMNDKEVNQYLESGGDYTLEKLKEFLLNIEISDILFWAIHLKENNKHIGNIKIDPIKPKHGLGEYGIMMGDKKEWGKGYAKEASELVINFCFSPNVNLRKITLGVVSDNISAVKLYEQLKFIKEGTYLKHTFHNGKYCDVYRYALFNNNFNE